MIWLTFLFAGWCLRDVAVAGAAKGCVGKGEVCHICNCSENNTTVVCTGMNLQALPEILPSNLIVLDMYKNHIETVDQNAFKKCYSLTVICLGKNNITSLPDGLFDDAHSLKKLKIHVNPLIINENSLVFNPLNSSLISLSIQRTKYISDEIFKNLFSLKDLKISGNITGRFGDGFSGLKNLQKLKLYPPLTRITDETFLAFEKCQNLTTLDLEYLDISFINEKAFAPLKTLHHLILGYNPKLDLLNVSKTFEYLTDNIKLIDASYLVNNFCPLKYLNETFYENFKNKSNLEALILNKNSLLHIDMCFPGALKHLKYLDISFNRLGSVFGLATLMFTMVNLTWFNANHQMNRPIWTEKEEINIFPPKEFLAQTNTFIKKRPYEDVFSKSTCVAKHEIMCIFPRSFERLENSSWCVACPKKLDNIFLKSIMDEKLNELPPVLLLGDCVVTTVDFGKNGLKKMTGPIIVDRPRAKKPLTIDLSYNGINCLAPELFDISIRRGLNIGRINLEGNDLSGQLEVDDGKMFVSYKSLTWLSLANNGLKKLHSTTFSNLLKLELLNLSRNSLQTLELNLSNLTCIRILDLSYNLFVIFSLNQLKSFSSLSAEKGYENFTLYIAENPFQCSCDSIEFLTWVMENTTHVDNIQKVYCLENSKAKSLDDIYNINKKLMTECHHYFLYEILGGLAALAIVCTLIGVTLYKFKWDIRYYMLKMTQKRKQYEIWLDKTTNYSYDAFVSYDQNDRWWIVQELIPNLEMPQSGSKIIIKDKKKTQRIDVARESCSNLILSSDVENEEASQSRNFEEISDTIRFCIHERDFEAGNNIEANIMSAIERSRKVLLLVSRHFIKSKWCRLELEMAKMESLERGRNIVVIVFLEPVEETLESLNWLTKRYTYLQWPACSDSSRQMDFWKRLKIAINEADPEKIVCICGKKNVNQ